jgi:hypothetical protein
MTAFPMLPDVGGTIAPANAPSVAPEESRFVERVNLLLGDRLKPYNEASLERDEAVFRQFRAWARGFGYNDLPAHGAIVAGYLMAIMSEIGCLNQVYEAARAVESIHATRALFLDKRYMKAAVAWAKDFRAGAACLN